MRRRTAMAMVAAVLGAAALAGCSSVTDSLQQESGTALAAAATAQRATALQLQGKAPLPYVATVYGDALTQLQSAEKSVAGLDATPGEAVQRGDVLATIRRAIDAVVTAQEDLNSGSGLRPDESALSGAVAALKKAAS